MEDPQIKTIPQANNVILHNVGHHMSTVYKLYEWKWSEMKKSIENNIGGSSQLKGILLGIYPLKLHRKFIIKNINIKNIKNINNNIIKLFFDL